MRFILRFLGLWSLAGAFVALIIDGTASIAAGAARFSPLKDTWFAINQNSLTLLQPTIERRVPWLWDPVLKTLLDQPTWLVLGVLGATLILLGRRKPPLIGYGRD